MASAVANFLLEDEELLLALWDVPGPSGLLNPCSLAKLESLSLAVLSRLLMASSPDFCGSNSTRISKASGSVSESTQITSASEGTGRDWEIVTTEDIEAGRPVSDQFPLRAASKKGEAKKRISLCVLEGDK